MSAVMQYLQSVVTWRINMLRGTPDAAVWQRKFYEHSIRNEHALERIREHILDNPATWDKDENNPAVRRESTS
jgi:REP element-mobilizing transposase RayT